MNRWKMRTAGSLVVGWLVVVRLEGRTRVRQPNTNNQQQFPRALFHMSKDTPIATPARALEQRIYHAMREFAPWPMAEVEGATPLLRAMNPAFCTLLNKSPEELLNRPMDDLFAEEHTTRVLLDRVLTTGEATAHVETAQNTPGPIFWAYTCWPVLADDGFHAGIMIQVTETSKLQQQSVDMNKALLISSVQQHELTDASERVNVRLRKEIQEREKAEVTANQLAAIVLFSDDAIVSKDLNGIITSWNQGADRNHYEGHSLRTKQQC